MTRHNIERDYGSYEEMVESFEYEQLFDEMHWDAPSRLNIGLEAIDRHPDDDVALRHVDPDGADSAFTYGDIATESNRFANVLDDLGVEFGDRVFTYLPRRPEHYLVMVGVLKAGAVFGAISERYGPDGISYRLEDCSASVVVTTAEHAGTYGDVFRDVPSVEHVVVLDAESGGMSSLAVSYDAEMAGAGDDFDVVETSGEDNALLYYTSGTTGPPKGVVHAHQWITAPAAALRYVEDLGDDDLYWSTGDMGWLTGPLNALGAWFWGGTIFVYEGEFDPESWVGLLAEHPITILHTVPTAYRSFVERDTLFGEYEVDLRHASSIGEPLEESTIDWGRERLGVTIHDTYGQTESGGYIVCNMPTVPVKAGSMGKPMPGLTVEIVKPESGDVLPPHETGQIAWKGTVLPFFKEYWGNAVDKADSYVGEWFLTGDLAYRDEDGYVWFEGRADDVILSSGYRIGPFEVENALTGHPAVTEAAVVPKPDVNRGNIVKAYVKIRPDDEPSEALAADIKEAVRTNLSKHEYPREIEFVEDFPRTVTGKIRRKELRERERSR